MDPRISRTRRSLQQALLALAREHSLDELTVGDIAERAEVNRSSFYQHYSDKETLLADALDAAAETAGAGVLALEASPEKPPQALVDYLAHIDANAALYRRVLGERGSAVISARLRDRIETLVRDGLARWGAPELEGIPAEVVASGIAGSALGVIEAWLARTPRPPAETAAEWVWRMVFGPGASGRKAFQ